MRAVHILFYTPDGGDFWLNHVVTAFDPPYSHCDIQFEDGIASSVYQNECVYWEPKNFSRLQYTRISLALDDAEYSAVRSFCYDAYIHQRKFDAFGFVFSKLPIAVYRPATKTFCSRYILEALQASGRLDFRGMDPALATPSRLHVMLSQNRKGFIHISEKRMQQASSRIRIS